MFPKVPEPNVAFAICEMTVGVPVSNGVAHVRCAK